MSEKRMGRSAVELTRNAIASGNGGDYDAMMAFYGPESSVDMTGVGLGQYSGPPAIRRFFEEWIGSCDEIEFRLEEVHDLGNGVVLASIEQEARPSGTHSFLRLRYAAVYLWVDGASLQVTHFRQLDEARVAAERLAAERG
jgi:ketosteroid isomerase-like protein